MDNTDEGSEMPLSEVGFEGQSKKEEKPPDKDSGSSLLSNMETLLSRLVAAQQPSVISGANTPVQLIHFNPDDTDADVEGWCRVSELIVKSKNLEGVPLLMALTTSLKGRAATCLTKLPLD